jgi:threonine dehydratase
MRLMPLAVRTPIVRCEGAPQGHEVFLKLENLQPTGSFKIRPVGNAVLTRPRAQLADGIYTSSSGNSALAVAWMARRLGIEAAALVTPHAPEAKLARLRSLGARIVALPDDQWWRSVEDRGLAGERGTYIDVVRDPAALAGDATIGLEILEELTDVEAIFVPFGGGALACGIACAARALKRSVKVIACELETAQPFGAALRAGRVVRVEANPGFVSGVGFPVLLEEMWPLCRELLAASLVVPLTDVAAAIRLLAERQQVIVEGAGAIPVAAALNGGHGFSKVCAVVSGGNLGGDMLSTILSGALPR